MKLLTTTSTPRVFGEVGRVNSVSLLQEDAESRRLALRSCEAEIIIEIRAGRRKPWKIPSHPPFVRPEICERGARDEGRAKCCEVKVLNGTQVVHHH